MATAPTKGAHLTKVWTAPEPILLSATLGKERRTIVSSVLATVLTSNASWYTEGGKVPTGVVSPTLHQFMNSLPAEFITLPWASTP